MSRERIRLGRQGEKLALKTIEALGYQCIERNYRCPMGEVDIVARDGDTLVFLEIKTRKSRSIAYAKEAVNNRKRRQLSKVALAYMKANNCSDARSRFDVVAVSLKGDKRQVELIRNAFDLEYA